MGKPYYELDQETRHIILELQKKCIELNLGEYQLSLLPIQDANGGNRVLFDRVQRILGTCRKATMGKNSRYLQN